MTDREFTIEGWAVPEGIPSVHALVERARTEHAGLDEEAFMMLETAAIEIAGNVVEHGRPPGQVWWSFTLRVSPDCVEAILADDGQKYEGDLSAVMPDPLAESGRGIPLARAAVDELSYAHVNDLNVWTMRRTVNA